MDRPGRPKVPPGTRMFAVVGPTGIGKTAAAVAIAPPLNAEIISADSIQVYRGMDIGTSKPTPLQRSRVPFHMIDMVDPGTDFSVARFKELADEAVSDMVRRGRLPLLVGGSGLYYRAVVDDLDFSCVPQGEGAQDVAADLGDIPDIELHQLLRALDGAAADEIPPSNRRRVLKAIEVARAGSRLISERQRSWSGFYSPYDLTVVGLEMDRSLLYRLIEKRVDAMMEAGLTEEVSRLREKGLRAGTTAGEALGYRQLLDYLDGKSSLEQTVVEIKTRTRNFSKRQLTWFRKDPRVKWFEVRAGADAGTEEVDRALADTAGRVLEYLQYKLEN